MRSVLVLMVLAAVAHADPRILVMADEDRIGALELSLANHAEVASAPALTGTLPLERAGEAQRSCVADGAWAAVFADGGSLVVVSADGAIRSAPLPVTASPRTFAAIAISLLDELGDPPTALPHGHVDVQVAPTLAPAITAVVAERPMSSRAAIEAGVAMTPSSIGAQLEVTFPLRPHLRVGAIAGINQLFDGIADINSDTTAYDFAGEIRYIIGDNPDHWEVGAIGGVLTGVIHSSVDFMGMSIPYDDHDTGGFIGARVGYTHQFSGMTVTGAISPILMFDFRGEGGDKSPGVITSLTFGLPI